MLIFIFSQVLSYYEVENLLKTIYYHKEKKILKKYLNFVINFFFPSYSLEKQKNI